LERIKRRKQGLKIGALRLLVDERGCPLSYYTLYHF
jgi:hypothetical protein